MNKAEFKAWLWLKTIGKIRWYLIDMPRHKRIRKLENKLFKTKQDG